MVVKMLTPFIAHEVTHVMEKEKIDVDIFSKMTQSAPQYVSQLSKIEEVRTASIDVIKVNDVENEDDKWMIDLIRFLVNEQSRGIGRKQIMSYYKPQGMKLEMESYTRDLMED